MSKTRTAAAVCLSILTAGTLVCLAGTSTAAAQPARSAKKPEFTPVGDLVKRYELEKVISTTDGSSPFYELHKNDKTGKLFAILPRNYEGRLIMIAGTVSGGDAEAGVMGPTVYAEWQRFDKQLALVAPNLRVRTDSKEAKSSVDDLYTGRVLFSTPIAAMAPGNRPVIDLGSIALSQAGSVFGFNAGFGPSLTGVNPSLSKLTKAKAFPENVIFEYEAPQRRNGQLTKFTWSISDLKGTPGYKPRAADSRVGYFYNWHQDFAAPSREDLTDRYITRWNIQKADPRLRLSPPKEPLVWYVEHTVPIKYRRWVREGIELWNEAFEEVGIAGALEVRQQDATTGAYMDIDPEDARYNFFRWNTNDVGYAIGPSRTNPYTGEILDADVVWNEGLTKAIRNMLTGLSNDIVDKSFDPEGLAFLAEHPEWDPRVRLAHPAKREQMMHHRAMNLEKAVNTDLEDTEAHPWTHALQSHQGKACAIGNMLSMDFSLADAAFAVGMLSAADEDEATIDGLPEQFIGPMIRYISAHEVGHCIGLQHNMAASTIRTLEEINSEGYEGATIGSVMDYAAVNINYDNALGDVQGPYATPTIGPYDYWAIAFGYGDEKNLDEVLSQVSEPDHIFISQTAMSIGSDPRNMTWDLGARNIEFAKSRLAIVADLREKLIDDITDEGESWATVRRKYNGLLGTHIQALAAVAPWVGGTYTNNDFKGDPGERAPIEDVAPEDQREAMNLTIEYAFEDEAFGLSPELVRYFGKEYWTDPQGFNELLSDPSLDVHDAVSGVQATALSILMSPTRLRRIYDNEFRTQGDSDQFTAAELLDAVTDNVWQEYKGNARRGVEVSSFRRNLQREHTERLITLALLDSTSPTLRTISSLAKAELADIKGAIGGANNASDPYVAAHVAEIGTMIDRAMEASYTKLR